MPTLFAPAIELLERYAEYHRDRRNLVTHALGVPMVVFALGVLLAGISWRLGGLAVTPAWLVYALAAVWYLTRGHLGLGAATSLAVGALVLLAHGLGDVSLVPWLASAVGCLVIGWALQCAGHYYEGRAPTWADDLGGLLVAPMFVVLELLAPLGLFRSLHGAVERHAGPPFIRDLAQPATR